MCKEKCLFNSLYVNVYQYIVNVRLVTKAAYRSPCLIVTSFTIERFL